MQEEVMERGRSTSAAAVSTAKPAGADQCKVDFPSRYNRYGRKRDNGYSNKSTDSSKPSGNGGRRVGLQKTRDWVDRRPRSRAAPEQQQAVDASEEVKEVESASNAQKGPRKANLNHLLNFTFNAREKQIWQSQPIGRKRRTSYKIYNKEQFLQANCQFVVSKSGDYKIHAAEPDKLVDWSLIEQVRVFDHEVVNCPICLYPPTAARITRCGHVYCWSCILHYLSLDDSSWRKCPICFDAVHRRDLKSVLIMPTHAYQTGETLTLRLMRKARGSTVISPANSEQPDLFKDQQLVTMDASGVETCYCKLLLANPAQVTEKIIKVERQQLLQQKSELENGPECVLQSLEASFVELALEELDKRQELLELNVTHQIRPGKPGYPTLYDNDNTVDELSKKVENVNLAQKRVSDKKMIVYACAFEEEELDPDQPLEGATDDDAGIADDVMEAIDYVATDMDDFVEVEDVEDLALPSPLDERADSPNAKNKDYFYFYQVDDGQHIYLHSVNARCLMAEYGGLDKCPQSITGRVEALEPVSMSEELRRRLRYLNHLPLTCQFKFAQLQLKPPLISQKTLNAFEGEFSELRRRRQRKLRDERRVAKRQDRNDALKNRLQIYKTTTIVQSATCQPVSPPKSVEPSIHQPEPAAEMGSLATSQTDGGPNIPSFAQMLRLPTPTPPPVWPRVTSVPYAMANTGSQKPKDASSDDEGPAVPSYNSAFSDALQTALDSVSCEHPQAAKSRKNKQKKKLLFTTTMNRASAL